MTGKRKNAAETVDFFGNAGIIKVGKIFDNRGENGILKLTSKFVNSSDQLFRNADKIKPIEGYDDIAIHGSPSNLIINGIDGEEWTYNAKEAAEMIRNAADFHNRPIRLISCRTGFGENCIAQQLADELCVNVLAPTEVVNVDVDGEMFVCNNEVLAEIWNLSSRNERKTMLEPGKWIEFKPGKRS